MPIPLSTVDMSYVYDGLPSVDFFTNSGDSYSYDGLPFWLGNGQVLVSIQELATTLEQTSTFYVEELEIEELVNSIDSNVNTTDTPWDPGDPDVTPYTGMLDYSYNGQIFNQPLSKDTIVTNYLDFLLDGQPIVFSPSEAVTLTVSIEELVRSRDETATNAHPPAITTPTLLETMQYVYHAWPFVSAASSSITETELMKYVYDAQPMVVLPYSPDALVNTVNIEELINVTDPILVTFPIQIEELIDSIDDLITNQVIIEELAATLESTLLIVNIPVEELIDALEESDVNDFYSLSGVDTIPLSESEFFTINLLIQELANALEQTTITTMGILTTDYSSCQVEIVAYASDQSTVYTAIGQYASEIISLDLEIAENNIPAFASLTSASNDYEPTVAIDGVYLVSNPSTNPGNTEVAKASVYIHWLSQGISGNEWTDLFNYSFDLDYSGGSFSILSKKPLNVSNPNPNPAGLSTISFNQNYFHNYNQGPYVPITSVDELAMKNLGYQATVFGLKGTILDFGGGISDSQTGWSTGGIFGNPLLNRNMNFLLYNSPLRGLLTNTGSNKSLTTVDARTAAFQVASICGVTVTWALPNLPLQDTLRFNGQTGIQMLTSLAGLCGGTIRWDGNNHYTAAYPNQSFGLWEVPNPKLLTSAGCRYSQHMDLETGLSGSGVLFAPRLENRKNNNTANQGGQPAIQRIGSIGQKLTDEDPPRIFDLPPNYDRVYIQILVASGADTGGNNDVSINNFMTDSPEDWFEFDTSLLTNPGVNTGYVFNTYIGNTFIPQVKIDHHCFPNVNTPVDNGNFIMNLACSTKSLSAAFDENKNKLNDAKQNQLAAAFESGRFIKTYSGTITCQFFGTLPIPGMWGKAVIPGGAHIYTYDSNGDLEDNRIPLTGDFIVEGVIENVQFNFPGTVTIQVAQYARINYGSIPMNNISLTGGVFT